MTIRAPRVLLIVLSCILAANATSLTCSAIEKSQIKGKLMDRIPVPDELTIDDVRSAIAFALAGRNWEIKSKAEDHFIGYLNHRGREVTLTIPFDSQLISIYSDGWLLKKDGTHKKEDPALSWVTNLSRDLEKMLDTAAAVK
jgi:hypothetical protein